MSRQIEYSTQDNRPTDPQLDTLKYQLDFLKIEVDQIEKAIARMDQITQTTKNWAVMVWAGGVALILGQQELRMYIGLTAILPLSFWFIDATWRRLQSRAIYRSHRISEFLNDGLSESCRRGALYNFTVFDTMGTQYKHEKEYREWTRLGRTFKYPEIRVFYLVFVLTSLGLQVFILLLSLSKSLS